MSVRYEPATHAPVLTTALSSHHLHWFFAMPLQLPFAVVLRQKSVCRVKNTSVASKIRL